MSRKKASARDVLLKIVFVVFGVICGGFVGLALGVALAMGVGYWSQLSSPDDPSAGAVAIIVILTAPLGAMCGAGVGGLLMALRPRLFLVTVLPLAILFAGIAATYSTMNSWDRPRHFVVNVGGTAGAQYVAEITIDGKREQRSGVLPVVIEADALRLELAFALLHPQGQDRISIEVTSDGASMGGGFDSPLGIQGELESVGYSEFWGGTSRSLGIMTQEQFDHLIQRGGGP